MKSYSAAAATSTTATASTHTATSGSSTHGVHFLFTDSFFDINAFTIDLVASLEDTFVNRVIIVKFDKAESSGFTGIFFCQTSD